MSKVTIRFYWVDRDMYLTVDQYLKVNSKGIVERVENGITSPEAHLEPHFFVNGERIA